MTPTTAADRVIFAFNRLSSEIAAARFMRAAERLRDVALKANFDPNQPRVPAGDSEGGRWTRVEGWAGSQAVPTNQGTDRPVLLASDSSGMPPEVPRARPPTGRSRWLVVKQVARWLFRVGVRVSPIGRLIEIVEVGSWIYEYYPYVKAYLDAPRSLAELRAMVAHAESGYDVHHIVEQAPAESDGYPRSLIDAPENLARIPTLKHWELNAWYGRPNERFGGLSPRAYLRGKDWGERERVGRLGLVEIGVLKP